MIEYFLIIISESANRPGFDWRKYDTLFCQGALLNPGKCWGIVDQEIWVQCFESDGVTTQPTSTSSFSPARRASVKEGPQASVILATIEGKCDRERCSMLIVAIVACVVRRVTTRWLSVNWSLVLRKRKVSQLSLSSLLNPIPHGWGGRADSTLLQMVFFITLISDAAKPQNLVTFPKI